jgi:hypothetical protein
MELFKVTIEIGVFGKRKLTAAQVHEALCQYLHEECVNFNLGDPTVIEFTNVGRVRKVTAE